MSRLKEETLTMRRNAAPWMATLVLALTRTTKMNTMPSATCQAAPSIAMSRQKEMLMIMLNAMQWMTSPVLALGRRARRDALPARTGSYDVARSYCTLWRRGGALLS